MSFDKQLYWDQTLPLLRLSGSGCRAFRQGQATADILGSELKTFICSCWLSAIGRVRALLEIRLNEEGADVVILAGDCDQLVKGFEQVIFPADQVKIDSLSTISRLKILTSEYPHDFSCHCWIRVNDPLPKGLIGLDRASTEQVEMWRLRKGLPIGPGEINGKMNPFELGLSNLVNLDKGCYLGQETVAKLSK